MNNSDRKHKVLSLFSGCGGLDLGFGQAGAKSLDLAVNEKGERRPCGLFYEVVWSNDIYLPSCKTYAKNFGAQLYENSKESFTGNHRIFHGDVAQVLFETAVDKEPIDVILGGFPCQDFSVIRGVDKRKGVEVKRGRLYCHFVRALATLQPAIFVAENVKGLVSANGGKAYEYIKRDFENLNVRWKDIEAEYNDPLLTKESPRKLEGYRLIFSDVLNFKNIGVPQARERLIIIGLRKDLLDKYGKVEPFELSFENRLKEGREYFSQYPLTPLETLKGDTLSNLAEDYKQLFIGLDQKISEINSERKNEFINKIYPKYSKEIWEDYFKLNRNGNSKYRKDQHVFSSIPEFIQKSESVDKEHKKVLLELGFYQKPVEKVGELDDKSNVVLSEGKSVKDRMVHIPFGENHEFVRGTEFHVQGLMSNIYRRLHPIKPSPTVIARGGGGTWGYHYVQDRQRLTNRERARLQTFPDTFMFEGKAGEVRRQIGEAVPPLAGKFIAEKIIKILQRVI